jgi:hypothetical protein
VRKGIRFDFCFGFSVVAGVGIGEGGGLGGVGEDVEGFEPAVFFCEVTFLRVDRDIGGRAI